MKTQRGYVEKMKPASGPEDIIFGGKGVTCLLLKIFLSDPNKICGLVFGGRSRDQTISNALFGPLINSMLYLHLTNFIPGLYLD